MAYAADKKPLELTALTSLATDDTFIVGDTSDTSEVVKSITKADLKTDLGISGTNTGDQTTIVGITGTKAQFDTACSDGNFLYVGDVTGISDGDKGDITVSASGATWTIDNGAVTLAKQADMATSSVVYRKTAGSGAPEVQTLSTLKTDLGLTGTNSGDQTSIVGITGTMAQFDTAVSDGNIVYQSQALGTPSSGTLTNCTGLPLAGVTDSTTEALGVGSLEVGHASDTTISRSSAGVIAVEGVVVPSISSTNTLTNKRITRRVSTTNAPGATPTTNTDNVDVMNFTGLNTAITSMTTNLSGTPADGDLLEFRFTDDGTARAITWGASFAATTVALPTTTVISTMLRVGFEYSGSTWKCIATA